MSIGRRMIIIWSALSLAIAGGLGFGAWTLFGPDDRYEYNGGFFGTAAAAPALDLTDQHGQPFSLDSLRGKVVFLYFGYTACPDYCPTTMADLQSVKSALGDQADDVAVVMVTVDPERDTPARLDEYLSFFDPAYIGLTGTPDAVRDAARSYNVMFAAQESTPAAPTYLVDHSTSLLGIDTGGNLRMTWAYGTDPALIAEDVAHLLDE